MDYDERDRPDDVDDPARRPHDPLADEAAVPPDPAAAHEGEAVSEPEPVTEPDPVSAADIESWPTTKAP